MVLALLFFENQMTQRHPEERSDEGPEEMTL